MSINAKISIITINYNDKEGLLRTFKSIKSQCVSLFELVVIDGGSTDGSKKIIKEYESYIDYWVSESDFGVYNAMNKGIERATGEYVLFLNSGDYFYNDDSLSKIINELDGTRQNRKK